MITYPVDVENKRFTFKLGGNVKRGRVWPRPDGMELAGKEPSLVVLEEIIAAVPAYDPATQKLTPGTWVDDDINETATFSRTAIPLSQAELDESLEQQQRQAMRVVLAQGISTLEQWESEAAAITVTAGNNNAVTQQLVNHFGVLAGNLAKLFKVLYMDK